ncbi:hypothetical protein VWY34_14295 [Phaeobacter sp. JH20_02]|uniref:hypothetical protein n=1 Tax=unclassified Phaeobacter TaxID=2621772 RepID=UPI003A872FEA
MSDLKLDLFGFHVVGVLHCDDVAVRVGSGTSGAHFKSLDSARNASHSACGLIALGDCSALQPRLFRFVFSDTGAGEGAAQFRVSNWTSVFRFLRFNAPSQQQSTHYKSTHSNPSVSNGITLRGISQFLKFFKGGARCPVVS